MPPGAFIVHDDGRVQEVGDDCLALSGSLCDPCLCNEGVPGYVSRCRPAPPASSPMGQHP